LRNLRRFFIDQYQLCATTDCQVYFGLSQTSPKADKAILATKGEVLTYRNELIDALYSDMTGGISANFQDAWDGQDKPYLKSLIDSPKALWDLNQYPLSNEISFRKFIALTKGFNESKRHLFRWNKTITLLELSKQIREYLLKSQISKLNPNKVL
jgi:SpoIID/LytB domain protein